MTEGISKNTGDHDSGEDERNGYQRFEESLNYWRTRWKHRKSKWFSTPIEIIAIVIGFLTLVTVVVGGRIAFWSWREMQATVEQARRQAVAAESSVQATTRAYQMDQRAWVHCGEFFLDKEPVGGDSFRVTCRIVNSGKTPALNSVTAGAILLAPIEFQPKFQPPAPKFATVFPTTQLSFTDTGFDLGPTDRELIADYRRPKSQYKIWAWFLTTYEDVFGVAHCTQQCVYHPFGAGLKNFAFCDTGNQVDKCDTAPDKK